MGLGLMGTYIGAIAHQGPGGTNCETEFPCFRYKVYGWPWAWTTNAPAWHIELTRGEEGPFQYGPDGTSIGTFVFTAFLWSTAALLAEGMLAFLGWCLWRLLRRRSIGARVSPGYLIPAALSLTLVAVVITNVLLVVAGYDRIFPAPCNEPECAITNETYRP